MGTRAAAFTAKVRNLQDYHSRLTNGIMPLPTGIDISNTLKYFSQTLLGVLKDVPQFPLEMLRSRNEDAARMQLFPNLDYKALFTVLVQLIDVTPAIPFGVQTFGQSILHTISSLLPFLEHDQVDTLPYIVASSLGTFPASLHKEILDILCYYLFPFTLYKTEESPEKAAYATHSVSAVLMMVFQYTSGSEYHCQILEAVMRYKRDAIKDLLCVVAYGSLEARNVAINLLVYFFPHHNPTLYDRRNVNFKFTGRYKVPSCRSEMCSVHNTGGLADATKVCYDHSIGISLAPENPPPLFLCQECSSRLMSEQPSAIEHLYDVGLPISRTGTTCDNKNCRSQGPEKIMNGVICFNSECASYNGNRPIRYCQQCHLIRHNNRRGADHVFHLSVQAPNYEDTELLNYHVEAIVSLLLESEPLATRGGWKDKEDQQTRLRLFTDGEFTDPIPQEERRLMGRFGIWLLVGFFNAEEEIPRDILSRLLSSLFQWFNTTAYSADDPSASALERLKADVVCPWLKKVIKSNFETFVTCLLPHPPDFARVGGHWDVISSRTYHLREGFNRLFCLVPYDVISPEIWSQIMPNWMESMASEVPEEEMAELKIILSKVMDPEMNPLGFDARQMYQFIAVRFHQTSHKVKEQALKWLQVLSKLEIVIPLYFIFSIFREGIRPRDKTPKRGSVSTQNDANKDAIAAICQEDSPNASSLSDEEENFQVPTEKQSEGELMLSSFIFMLDIILKQLELQEVEQHKGIQSLVARDAMTLLHSMVASPWPGPHACRQECQVCEMAVLWYQLALEIVDKLSGKETAIPPDLMLSPDGEFGSKFPEQFLQSQRLEPGNPSVQPKVSPKSEQSMGLEGIIVNMPQILTAPMETCGELDLAPILPSERVVKAVARAVTITETETASATATAHVASATLVGEEQVFGGEGAEQSDKDFWATSVGKFKFSIEDLPPYLQFTFELLKKIPDVDDAELMEYLLKSLKIMFLHEEVLQKASKEHRGFVIWCQENLLIKTLWELMDAEFSQLCEHSVPILLHCVTLPVGLETFWKQIEDDFQNSDWRCRFTAVERVVTITRFMDSYPVKSSQALQTALANAFCYTISSLDDPHVAVAQRAALYLGTINDTALQSLMFCLESQFDSVIIDRPVILQSLYLLINSVSDRKILRWDFFLNCFDTLFIEAQITLERLGDLSFSKDARHIDASLESFIKKLGRVQEGLSRAESSTSQGHKTLYSSLGTKWPYKRTMSAPAGFQKHDKDRPYCRQSSAPVLKRKGSRHGVEGHIHSLLSGDEHLTGIFHRIVEVEESDRETIHLVIFLFMQFLSRYSRGAIPSDNKALARTQTAVLRHVAMLLGYNSTDKMFFLTPSRLRSSPIFNSFTSNLQQVLDQNFRVGTSILPISLSVLHYCPAPNKNAGSRSHPNYSLWYMEPHTRKNWLTSLIVILYKYEYGVLPLSSQVQTVIRIVLNTLNYQEHRCRPLPSTLILDEPTARSREVSRGTLTNAGDLEHITEHETPPTTPTLSTQNVSPSFSLKKEHRKSVGSISSGRSQTQTKKAPPIHAATPGVTDSFEYMSSQDDGDEVEPELAAIPESPKSQGSGELRPLRQAMSSAVEVVQPRTLVQPSELQTLDQEPPLSAKSWGIFSSDGDSKSSSSGASGSSTGTGGGGKPAAKTEFPWHLSVQAAFQIAKIPAPPLERLLPVGNFSLPPLSPTVKSPSHGGRDRDRDPGSPYESPEMSLRGDMISLGPQLRVDDDGGSDMKGKDGGKPFRIDDYSKTLHQAESYARSVSPSSPKKLVKQGHVGEGEPGFEAYRADAGKESGKSVGFAQHAESSHSRLSMHNLRQSSLRIGDDCVQDRCGECGVILENYTNEELGLCLVALETFVHREPGLAAPMMPEILKVVTRIALRPLFAWQAEATAYYPGGVQSVAHQFLRCVLHQLAPYGVFVQLFQTKFPDRVKMDVFKSISISLTDFAELNPVAPLQMLLEALNDRKSLVMDNVAPIIENVASYLECLPLEAASVTWSSVIPLFEAFLRKILPIVQNASGVEGILRTMACLLRLPGISAFKSILDPFSKLLSFALGNVGLKYQILTDLCHLCHRGFLREREKQFLTRVTVIELVQAMKFKSNIPDANFLMLVTFILQDAGGSLAPYVYIEGVPKFPGGGEPISAPPSGAAECMRQHLTDSLEFLADFHSLSKIKSNYKGIGCGLNEDTLGGVIKGGISQFIALEISRGNSRENRAIGRHLPWLYNAPSAIQQGPKEFLDCVAHIRVLSWLLLGALTHHAMFGQNTTVTCACIPLEASCHVADHVHVIMTGFAEQSKASVLHMSSLFHAFILCQVWTIYLEQVGPTAQMSSSNDPANVASNILTDFWGKVTPAILQLISHSKVLAEMVNLHFLSLLESLLECNSSVFNRLLPLWSPVLYAHSGQLPSNVQVRLQACLGYPPPKSTGKEALTESVHTKGIEFPTPQCGPVHNLLLLKWVQKLQFKMAQIELQSSAATQFYPL